MIYCNHIWVESQGWMLLLRAKYLLCHLHPYGWFSKIRSHILILQTIVNSSSSYWKHHHWFHPLNLFCTSQQFSISTPIPTAPLVQQQTVFHAILTHCLCTIFPTNPVSHKISQEILSGWKRIISRCVGCGMRNIHTEAGTLHPAPDDICIQHKEHYQKFMVIIKKNFLMCSYWVKVQKAAYCADTSHSKHFW